MQGLLVGAHGLVMDRAGTAEGLVIAVQHFLVCTCHGCTQGIALAQDVGALPAPVAPQVGALLRVLSIRSDGSLVVDTVTPAALKTLLEAT